MDVPVNSLMFILRIPGGDDGNLESDFSGIPHPRAAVGAVVFFSCFSTFFGQYHSHFRKSRWALPLMLCQPAFLSLWVCHYEQRPLGSCSLRPIPPTPLRPRPRSPSPPRTYAIPFASMPLDPQFARVYEPPSQYDKWSTIPL